MMDFIMEYIMPIFLVMLVIMAVIMIGFAMFKMFNGEFYSVRTEITIKDENYIENLETRLNIYEKRYDDFVLEDNLNQ